VNLGAVTYHVHSKDELYVRVLEEVLGPIRDRIGALTDLPVPAPKRLELFVRGFFQHLRENPDTPRFFVQEVVLGEDPAPPILDTVRAVVTTLTSIVRQGQEEGSIREGDPVLMALSTLSQPIYLSVMTRVLDRDEFPAGGLLQPRLSAEDHAVEFVLGSLLARREEQE
jgi:AcrR family transcriptional regulator